MIDIIFKLSTSIIDVAKYADEAYHEGEPDIDSIVLSSAERLELMDIDNLVVCYQSIIVNAFTIKQIEQLLIDNYQKEHLYIRDIITRKNCIYIKVMHAIPFTDKDKCYGTSFSINYMESNNCISVYGIKTKNTGEKQAFKEIAHELITTLSK
jgi:hypothetical protein